VPDSRVTFPWGAPRPCTSEVLYKQRPECIRFNGISCGEKAQTYEVLVSVNPMTLINTAKSFLILLMGLLVFGACDRCGPSTEGHTAPKHSATIPSKQTASWAYKNGERRHAEFNEIAQRRNIDLVFLGDSITQGWEDVRDVWDKYYSRRKVTNFGMNGDHTQHVLWRIEHGNFEGIHPKAIIILIGANNSIAGNTAQEIADGVMAVVQKLREKVPGSKILLLAIFPSGERPENPQRVRTIAANTIF